MLGLIATVLTLLLLYSAAQYRALQRNIRDARESGLKYVIAPVYFQSIPWILCQEALLPILRLLPDSLTNSWLPLSLFFRIWTAGYGPFHKAGTDTFIIVSAGGNVLWTCDPNVIMQLSHGDFIKPTEMLDMLNLYGPAITAAEGEQHRTFRKIAAPSFNESVHGTVWAESIRQAGLLLTYWDDSFVEDVNLDANRFALHVLSKSLFNKELGWDTEFEKPDGHDMSYPEAVSAAFKYNDTLFFTPKPILNISPMKEHKRAKQASAEFRKYLEKMVDEQKKAPRNSSKTNEGGNLLEHFVKASQATDDSRIPDAAVFGNLFIFILAGHETSANTMTFALSLLACRPEFQKSLQGDIDTILGDRDPAIWKYPQDYTKLIDGHVGALMNEILRLYSVLPFIPKTNDKTQVLTIDGVKHVLAPKTLSMINTSAVHRHPDYWRQPSGKLLDAAPYPVSSFHPERWLSKDETVPGSFVPFAEGFRSCMGSRFARIEFCAAIAAICKIYTVELKDGTREEAIRKGEAQLSSGIGFEMGLKMKEPIALRFKRRE